MIEQADVHQRQRLLETLGDGAIGCAGLGIAAGVVVHHPTAFVIIMIFNDFSEEPLKVVPGFGSCA